MFSGRTCVYHDEEVTVNFEVLTLLIHLCQARFRWFPIGPLTNPYSPPSHHQRRHIALEGFSNSTHFPSLSYIFFAL